MKNEIADSQKLDDRVHELYIGQINYYWNSSRLNNKSYKYYRVLPIFLGAFLTFASSISSTDYISTNQLLKTIFAIGTPLLAVFLTITNELSKISDWGQDWRSKVLTAQELEKEMDLYFATDPEKRNPQKELDKIHKIQIRETKSFFNRTMNKNGEATKETDADTS